MLTHDDRRLVVADYFLVEDMFPGQPWQGPA